MRWTPRADAQRQYASCSMKADQSVDRKFGVARVRTAQRYSWPFALDSFVPSVLVILTFSGTSSIP